MFNSKPKKVTDPPYVDLEPLSRCTSFTQHVRTRGVSFRFQKFEFCVLTLVSPGQIVAIIGKVGAGKSTLVSAILGELDHLSGTRIVQGSMALVTQQAW